MRWLGSVASEPFCLQVLFPLKQKCVSILFPDALGEEPRSLAVRTSPGIYLQGLLRASRPDPQPYSSDFCCIFVKGIKMNPADTEGTRVGLCT